MVKIGKKLKELRVGNNLSINDLIEKLNELSIFVTKKTVYRWENDKVIPSIETIRSLSYIYNTNISEIYESTKFYKALSENEFVFITLYRENVEFKKIVKVLSKM